MKKAVIVLLLIFLYIFVESYTTNKSLLCGVWQIQNGDRKGEELVLNKDRTCYFSSNKDELLEYSMYDEKHIGIYSTQHKNPGFDDIGTFKRNRKGDKLSISWYDSPKMKLILVKRYN